MGEVAVVYLPLAFCFLGSVRGEQEGLTKSLPILAGSSVSELKGGGAIGVQGCRGQCVPEIIVRII